MVTNSNIEESLDVVQPFMQTDTGELFQSDISNFAHTQNAPTDDHFGNRIANDEPQFKLPPQRRCFSHILNLTSQDFERTLPSNADKAFK